MKKTLLVLVALLLATASLAVAKEIFEKPIMPYTPNSRATEVEPNDTPATANTLTMFDDMSGAIPVSTDLDYFAITVNAGDVVTFETKAGTINDTLMWLYASNGTTQLAYDDDGGDGLYSKFVYTFTAAGTYYVKVDGYSSNVGSYILKTSIPLPPPANDQCSGAIDLQSFETNTFQVDLCAGYTNNYNAGGSTGCTGYTSAGPDATYKIYLLADEIFTVALSSTHDASLWLVTDCAAAAATCVAGNDLYPGGAETFSYAAAADGWYYLLVDGYSGCSMTTITIDAPVANEDASWGNLKAMFK